MWHRKLGWLVVLLAPGLIALAQAAPTTLPAENSAAPTPSPGSDAPAGVRTSAAGETPQAAVPPPAGPDSPPAPLKLGVTRQSQGASAGYTLIATMNSSKTHLIDLDGRVVHTWTSDLAPALTAYLLDSGELVRPGNVAEKALAFGSGPGAGGKLQKFSWDGELVWDYDTVTERTLQHHDVTPLPNGNVLMIAWDKKTEAEAIAAGRRPETVRDSYLLPDCLLEVKPTGKTTGEVVWEWHLWDHLVQDFDKTKSDYGIVSQHPELVDLNFSQDIVAAMAKTSDGQDKLRSIGYVGATTQPSSAPPAGKPAAADKADPKSDDPKSGDGKSNSPPAGAPGPGGPGRPNPDWTHFNGVAYNAELDQIVISVHSFSEIWIIDHSTTTAEAATHSGGRRGKGGDLLYRWGNPRAYRSGSNIDQRLFGQHNAHWIPQGHPGAGHLLVFNNGAKRPDGNYSTVDELVPSVDASGNYVRQKGLPFGPSAAEWTYVAPKKEDLYSMLISGAQRLPNGNTLICSGMDGAVTEVTPASEIVWQYVNPEKGDKPTPGPPPGGPGFPGGPGGPFVPPPLGQIMPGFLQGMIQATEEQRKSLDGLNGELVGKLEKLLTDEQRQRLKPPGGAPFFFGPEGPPRPGEIMPASLQQRAELSDDQKLQLASIQKEADGQLDKILNDAQRKQLQEMHENFARGPFGGPPPGGPGGPGGRRPGGPGGRGGPGGPPGGPPFGPGGPGGPPFGPGGPPFGPGGPGGPPGGMNFRSSLFRSTRFAPDHPAFAGRDLTAGKLLEELNPKDEPRPDRPQPAAASADAPRAEVPKADAASPGAAPAAPAPAKAAE